MPQMKGSNICTSERLTLLSANEYCHFHSKDFFIPLSPQSCIFCMKTRLSRWSISFIWFNDISHIQHYAFRREFNKNLCQQDILIFVRFNQLFSLFSLRYNFPWQHYWKLLWILESQPPLYSESREKGGTKQRKNSIHLKPRKAFHSPYLTDWTAGVVVPW